MKVAGVLEARRAWRWFIDGLVEAVLWGARRGRPAAPFRLEIGDAGARLLGPDGTGLGSWAETSASVLEPEVARRLAGNDLDIVVPQAWIFRRELDPVAAQSRPFLDAFVRHQIERITPWRADTVHHRVIVGPLPGDKDRLAVAAVIAPKRLIKPWLDPLAGIGLATVRVRTQTDVATAITVSSTASPRIAVLRRTLSWGVATLAVATVLLVGVLEWQVSVVRGDVEDGERVIAERRAVILRARAGNGPGDGPAARLASLREAHPLKVAIVDALATVIPDSAHLTALSIDGDAVAITGVSTDPPALVPALERSGRFKDVASSAPTSRSDAGDGERFSLAMTALPASLPEPKP